jgi:hypothetical protein
MFASQCQAKQFLGEYAGKLFNRNYRALKKHCLQFLTINCELDEEFYRFEIEGPETLLDHPRYISGVHAGVPHPSILKRPYILKRINEGNKVKASKTLMKELGFHEEFAHDIVQNVIAGMATATTFKSSFITDKEAHLNFINSLHSNDLIVRNNNLALNHLTSIVPFIEDVYLNDILKIREREKESFILSRQALNEAIVSFSKTNERFSEKDAKELYRDVIHPKLCALDKKVRLAKRDLIRKPFRSLTGVIGAISFGVLTGIITPDTAAIANAIGLVKFGSDMIDHTMALGDKEDAIKDDQFYFLWKLRNQS